MTHNDAPQSLGLH